MKPQLAEDAILDKMIFPVWAQPKIDGVRALNLNGTLTGRSLDPFKGFGVTEMFAENFHHGLDGEMILGSDPACRNRLCSMTTGAMGRFKGVIEPPDLHWWLFDLVTPETLEWSYEGRYHALEAHLAANEDPRLHLVPFTGITNRAEADRIIGEHLDQGYEGTIFRNPRARYKEGRATQKGQELWRVKPWGDFEIEITGVTEGNKNTNEAKKNSLGRTERSSAKAGLVPNGMIGTVHGRVLEDVKDHNGKVLFKKGLDIDAGPGEMTDEEAAYWFANQHEFVGHIGKIKHMTHGVKDKPRFPTFMSKRLREDMLKKGRK